MRRRSIICLPLLGLLTSALLAACGSADRELILATTTSTENSGLLDELIPRFEEAHDADVSVIAVGSGAALEMGRRGDADVLLVHSPEAEQELVADGAGIERTRVMYNDYIIVGPPTDPAGIAGSSDAAAAFAAIAEAGAGFVSRGDDSGTHAKERSLWAAAGLEIPGGEDWYTETGQGMSATLTIARETEAYTLTDRATWLATTDHEALPLHVEGDEDLFNVYHVIVVNPERHEDVNEDLARAFKDFLVDPEIQRLIGEFGTEDFGQPLFVAYAE